MPAQEKIKLSDLVALFRHGEQIDDSAILLGPETVWAVFSQWRRAVPVQTIPKPPDDMGEHQLWDYLWEFGRPNADRVRRACGLNDLDFNKIVDQLQNARLIYPDATVHEEASRVLRGLIALRLPRGRRNAQT